MESNIYRSMAARTKGDIYIGVVGPVRTGKSTFIKTFMEEMILPNIDDVYVKERAKDELPQSGSGKTIMTAEPKFVPEDAIKIMVDDKISCNMRLIDCVGYMVKGALGQFEGDAPRMVTTPWFDREIPLAEAAEIGTRKVICEHSTIGIVVTTDGSIGEIERTDYAAAEERIIKELKDIDKPFTILLNCTDPYAPEAQELRAELEKKYGVSCTAANCMHLKSADIEAILSSVLYEFPAKEFCFTLPEWIEALPEGHTLKDELYERIFSAACGISKMRDAKTQIAAVAEYGNINRAEITEIDLADGRITTDIQVPQTLFYNILTENSGIDISSEGDLLPLLCEMARIKKDYARLEGALAQVKQTGYGIVMPSIEELRFEPPEIVKHGGQFGVKLKAGAPSIHMIRADIETEISPIVGSEKQSEDLIRYLLSEFNDSPEKIWDTNIFGKSLSELVNEGLNNKLYKMPDDARAKLQETLQRIINEGSGGLICIIL
ncbi:MAG: stage IV sporulation protein A [Clostridia bacterium]|nr:stage IV sporulation protein A [Clostridia bacterium]